MSEKMIENNKVSVIGEIIPASPSAMRYSEKDSIWWTLQ